MPGGGETGTQKLSDGSQEDCGPEAFGAWEKRKTSASKWGTWSEHLGTTHILSLLGFCPPSRILTNTFASPLPTQLQAAGEQSVSFHLQHPRYVCLQQGFAHDKLTSCLWRDWSIPMLGEPSQPVGTTHASRETRTPPVGNTWGHRAEAKKLPLERILCLYCTGFTVRSSFIKRFL